MNAPPTRRELLKLTPLLALGAFAVPSLQERLLRAGLRLSDAASEAALGARRNAETFPDASLTPLEQFPYNQYDKQEPEIDFSTWTLAVEGEVRRPGEYTLEHIRALPRQTQNVRHICIEGWSVVGSFGGARLCDFLDLVDIPNAFRLGGWLGGALQWHFAFAGLFVGGGIVYVVYQFLSGRWRQTLFLPADACGVWPMVRHYLGLGHAPPFTGEYNPLQKLAYTTTILFGLAATVTGLVLYKPVQLQPLATMLGGFGIVRVVHFLAMCGLLAFIPGHLFMVALHGWNNFQSILTGWKQTERVQT